MAARPVSRGKVQRPPLSPPERLRVDQTKDRRGMLRAEQHEKELAGARKRRGKGSSRGRRSELMRQRKLAGGLLRPLRCGVHTRGAGALDRLGRVGTGAALRHTPRAELVVAALFTLTICMVWAVDDRRSGGVVVALIWTSLFVVPALLMFAFKVWRRAHAEAPASLVVRQGAVSIDWADGSGMVLPAEKITGVETSFEDLVAEALRRSPAAREKGRVTVVVTRDDGASVRVRTGSKVAEQLCAAIEVARADVSARLRGQEKARRKERRDAEADPAAAPVPPAPPPLNEAALSALDRDGRSAEAWREGLRAAFAGAGYRRAPALPAEELLPLVTDPRVSAERRIGAAIALSVRGDGAPLDLLRIASTAQETPALRLAVERAAEGSLEDEVLAEALGEAEVRGIHKP